jgi:tetratricopeptide (TPR) repeat protein
MLTALAALAFAQPAWASSASTLTEGQAPPVSANPEIRDLQAAYDKLKADDYAAALPILLKVTASPSFNGLSSDLRYATYVGLGAAQYQLAQYKEALVTLKIAVTFDEADFTDWSPLLSVAWILHDTDDETVALTTIAKRWPTRLSEVDDDAVYDLINRLRKQTGGDETRFRLLAALHDAHWKPNDPFSAPDGLWIDLMGDYIDRGQLDKARAVGSDITEPRALIRIAANRRFDSVAGDIPRLRDIGGASDRELGRLRAAAVAHPEQLAGVVAVSLALIERERPKEALDLVDATLAKIPADKSAKSPFSDPDQLNWLLDRRAKALFRLGQTDKAIAVMEAGAQTTENGQPNVSQTLNLGGDLEELGRPAEALAAIKTINETNTAPYGGMFAAEIRACSYAQLHDAAGMTAAVEYAKAHIADSPSTVVDIGVCTRDLDLAAKTLIDELNDPKLRPDALDLVQNWLEPKVLSNVAREEHRRLRLVRDRPDVQAAITRVGRIGTFALYSADDL